MRAKDQAIEIIGPEGVPLHFPAATLSERVMAFGVDMALLFLGVACVLILFVMAGAGSGSASIMGIGIVLAFLIQHGYFIVFETHWQGATPGKRLLRLKVVSRDGAGLQTDAVIARNLMRDVELFVPAAAVSAPEQLYGDAPWWMIAPTAIWLLVMLLMPVLSRERTRVGDLVGGTLVVRIPKAELQSDEAARSSLMPGLPQGDAITFTTQQLGHYGERELETLADLIRKIDQGKVTPYDLQIVATTIAQKIGFGGDLPNRLPERFLRSFYKQQRAHLERRLLFGQRKSSKYDG